MKVWVLNLDAELELARSGPYQPTRAVLQALEPWAACARALLAAGDELLEDWQRQPDREGDAEGECWCPTPTALLRLQRAGVRPPPCPAVEVLRKVCHRRFYLELGGGAPGARYFEAVDAVERALADAAGAPWLFKRPFGFAGRGQRRLRRELSADDRRWLEDNLRPGRAQQGRAQQGRAQQGPQGGLLGEPWLEIERELSQHGRIHPDGTLRLGQPCAQRTDEYRAWLGTEPLAPGDLSPAWRRTLAESAERAAEALFRAGYFGPFGIDAYVWRTPAGALELNPLGELNTRYTMGYAAGMAHT